MEARVGNHPLQNEFEEPMRRMVSDGVFTRFESEVDLTRRCGASYSADFLAWTPSGEVFAIETDHPGHHSASADVARDECLLAGGVSTIRVSGPEIGSHEAERKVRSLVGRSVASGRPVPAGSTRSRKLPQLAKPVHGLPNVAVYLYIWHHGRAWGWEARAYSHRYSRRKRAWLPEEELASSSGRLLDAASRSAAALAALGDERFWEAVPDECNLRLYGLNVNVFSAASNGDGYAREQILARNAVSSQSVRQPQLRGEEGTNFALLGELEPCARAQALQALSDLGAA